MAHANPGLRPGLSSAVPAGLDIERVVLTQGLSPVPLHHLGQTRLAFGQEGAQSGKVWGLRPSSTPALRPKFFRDPNGLGAPALQSLPIAPGDSDRDLPWFQ